MPQVTGLSGNRLKGAALVSALVMSVTVSGVRAAPAPGAPESPPVQPSPAPQTQSQSVPAPVVAAPKPDAPVLEAGQAQSLPQSQAKPAATAPVTPPAPDTKPKPAPTPIASVFGQVAWQPPAPAPAPPPPPAAIVGGAPVVAPSNAAEASLRVSSVHLLGLIDHAVEASDHSEVGHVVDILSNGKGEAAAYVVEISGFLGVGNRHIALSADLVTVPADGKGALQTSLTPAQLRAAPTYDTKPHEVTVVTGADAPKAAADKAADKPGEKTPAADAAQTSPSATPPATPAAPAAQPPATPTPTSPNPAPAMAPTPAAPKPAPAVVDPSVHASSAPTQTSADKPGHGD